MPSTKRVEDEASLSETRPWGGRGRSGVGPPGAFVVVVALLIGANLLVRQLGDPRWQLRVYFTIVVAIGLVASLRGALFAALAAMVASGFVIYMTRYRDGIDHGRITRRAAIQRIVRNLTGVSPDPAGRHAPGALTKYAPYLDKIDARAPAVNQLAIELTRGCGSGDRVCETARILRFVTDDIEYRNDPRGDELIREPAETLDLRAGDCEDKSILLVSLLESVGHHSYMVFTPDHAYALDCYPQTLERMIDDQIAGTSGGRYLLDIAPRRDPSQLRAAIGGAVYLHVDDEYCYPLESTQAGSWIGIANGAHEYVTAFDPVTKQSVRFRD